MRRVGSIVTVLVVASLAQQAVAGAIWDELATRAGGGSQSAAAQGSPIAVSYYQDAPCPTGPLHPAAVRRTPRPTTVRSARHVHRRRKIAVVRHKPRVHRPHRRSHVSPARIARAPVRPPRCEVLRRDSLYRADVSPESGLYTLVDQAVAPEPGGLAVAPVAPGGGPNALQAYNPFAPNQYGGGGGPAETPTVKAPGQTGGGGSPTSGGGSSPTGGGGGTDSGGGGEQPGGGVTSSPSAAPEPQTWALMICGVGMIGGLFRASRRERLA